MGDVGDSSVSVDTRLGEIRGVRRAGVLHFRGMRYAQPPVRERRFLAPLASLPGQGLRMPRSSRIAAFRRRAAFWANPWGQRARIACS